MRPIASAFILALMLLAPRTAHASEIRFALTDKDIGEVSFSFGLVPFEMFTDFASIEFDGQPLFDPEFDGSVEIVSGPLLELVPSPDENTPSVYRYGPGTVEIAARWTGPGGIDRHGSFTGTLLDLTVTVCELCDSVFPGLSSGDVFAALGKGRFDGPLANALGVGRRTEGGAFFFGPDGISGTPASDVRFGGSHTGEADLVITASAPEPGMLVFALTAGAALLVRRRRRT